MRRVRRARRFKKSNNSRSFKFVRHYYIGTINSAAAVPVFGSIATALSFLPNSSEFTNLFDEYKITKLQLSFTPIKIQNNVDVAYTVPDFLTFVDKDDSAIPISINEFLQSPGMRLSTANRRHYQTLIPKFAATVYNTAITSGYGSRTGWLDCANPDIPHYGLKYYMGPSAIASAFSMQVFAKVTLLCRGVR